MFGDICFIFLQALTVQPHRSDLHSIARLYQSFQYLVIFFYKKGVKKTPGVYTRIVQCMLGVAIPDSKNIENQWPMAL